VFWNRQQPSSTTENRIVIIYLPVIMSLLSELLVYGHNGNHIHHYKGQCTSVSLCLWDVCGSHNKLRLIAQTTRFNSDVASILWGREFSNVILTKVSFKKIQRFMLPTSCYPLHATHLFELTFQLFISQTAISPHCFSCSVRSHHFSF